MSYSTIHRTVRYELQAKLKTPRPVHENQKSGVIEVFKRYLPTKIKGLIEEYREKQDDKCSIAYWLKRETRFGFRTFSGKKITLKGVKPQQKLQWHYRYYYVYGLVDIVNGRTFFYEFYNLNSQCFEIYLKMFAELHSNELHIIQLDNASFHTAKKLEIPNNIILLFQPSYCPELNPIERVWEYIKYCLRSAKLRRRRPLLFVDLEDLRSKVANILNSKLRRTNSFIDWLSVYY